jgi:hypothetical protein
VRNNKFAVFILGGMKIKKVRLQALFPQAVMQMLKLEQAFAENMADFKTYLTRYVFFAFLQELHSFHI